MYSAGLVLVETLLKRRRSPLCVGLVTTEISTRMDRSRIEVRPGPSGIKHLSLSYENSVNKKKGKKKKKNETTELNFFVFPE